MENTIIDQKPDISKVVIKTEIKDEYDQLLNIAPSNEQDDIKDEPSLININEIKTETGLVLSTEMVQRNVAYSSLENMSCISQTYENQQSDKEFQQQPSVVNSNVNSDSEKRTLLCYSANTSSIESQIENENIQDLRKLLSNWNQEFLINHFIDQNVFINVLKVIKRHHIERLLKDFDMGTQILFEHNLEEWRLDIGLPLQPNYRDVSFLTSSTPSSSSILPTSVSPSCPRTSTPTVRETRFTPYKKSESQSDDCNISLSNILNETIKGTTLVEYYNKYSKFQEEQRTALINLIAQYFEEKDVQITLSVSYRLEKEILGRFSSEKLEYYRSGKRGKIYNKFCNLKTAFKSAVSKHVLSTPKKESSRNYRPEKNLEPEDDANSRLKALKFDELTAEQFDCTWKACSHYRLKDIRSLESVAAIISKWPFYKDPSGYRLIDMDFNVAFENGNGLLNKWQHSFDRLIMFISSDGHVKEKNIKTSIAHLKNNGDKLSENSKNAVILWALHGYFVPTTKIIRKNDVGKNITTKYTIKNSQESFIFMAKYLQQVEDHIEHLKKTKKSIQPFIYCIGADLFSIEETYVYFENIRYKFTDLLKAVDICFKIMYVFNFNFPPESAMFYSFLETYFFNLKSVQNFPKVHVLSEYLKET